MTGETFKPILAEVNTCMHDKTVLDRMSRKISLAMRALQQSSKWKFEFTGPNQKSWIYFLYTCSSK
jgi:hypothetical protein